MNENIGDILYIERTDKEIKALKLYKDKNRLAYAKEYRNNNKNWFRALNIMLVLFILFNIGAMLITNILVMKNTDVELKEANPVVAENNNFVLHNEAYYIMSMFMTNIIVYSLLIFYHIFYTLKHIYTNKQFKNIALTYIILFIGFGFDFINDLGYMIGKIIFG